MRRRRAAREEPGDLLAHVCEVIGLFPRAGDEAIAEWVAEVMTGKQRRAGATKGPKRRPRR